MRVMSTVVTIQFVIFFIYFVLTISESEAARILAVFPFASISHQAVFRPITQELVKRGHEVIVITPDPAFPKGQAPSNLREIDLHDVSYATWQKHFIASSSKGNKIDLKTQLPLILNGGTIFVELQLQNKEVQEIIADKNKSFDLLLLEGCVKSALIYSYIYKNVPVIQISSLSGIVGSYESVGAPIHPLLYPTNTRQRLTNLTFWEKITELYNYYGIEKIFEDADRFTDSMFEKYFGPNVTPVADLVRNIDMLFLNVNPVFDGIRPVPPSVVYMGGLHQTSEKVLPNVSKIKNNSCVSETLKPIDSSENGVIYMSFGTNIDPTLLPAEKIQTFVRVFSELPYNVLWKWNRDELPGRTDNIKISKWLPQSDLLRHPNVKLFITQGGLQSTDEAITAGVPMIGVPLLGDQWYNVEKYVQHRIGVRLDMETLTDERLRNAIDTVITDESYRRNVIQLRELMKDQPQTSLERTIWWIEYVLRHRGAKHLHGPTANMSWAQYLEIELVLTILFALITCVTVVLILFYFLYTKITCSKIFKSKRS